MAWYKKTFGKTYLDIYSHRDDTEARKVRNLFELLYSPLVEKKGSQVLCILDLCSGQGRYSRVLAQAGHRVVGLDLSEELLREAQSYLEASPPLPGHIWLVRADMRRIPFYKKFDLVINMFTSFGYFEEDEENQKVLDSIKQALKPGGRFLIDYLNHCAVLKNLVKEDDFQTNGLSVKQWRTISADGLRVEKKVIVKGPDWQDRFDESVRLFSKEELENMLRGAGLEVDRIFGDYTGAPYTDDSPRLILTGLNNE
ncbi:MAG TPA: methyltransferase domain-containing protein [archaeon]|nr:methyltransferase domain-containing protein [archaeon]